MEISVSAALVVGLLRPRKSLRSIVLGSLLAYFYNIICSYLTISLARALSKDGKVISLELHKLNVTVISGGHYL